MIVASDTPRLGWLDYMRLPNNFLTTGPQKEEPTRSSVRPSRRVEYYIGRLFQQGLGLGGIQPVAKKEMEKGNERETPNGSLRLRLRH